MAENEELIKSIRQKASQSQDPKRISCAEALAIAKTHNAPARQVGQICNEQGIRICKCQLGCFE